MKTYALIFTGLLASASAFAARPVDPTLIGGEPAPEGVYPASLYASMGGSRCTATVVGSKVLLIAAHCVNDGGTAQVTTGGKRYSFKCTHHSAYVKQAWTQHTKNLKGEGEFTDVELVNATADWALCKSTEEVTGIKYEKIATDLSLLKVGDQLMLTGYGCIRPGGSGGNDGIYRIGKSSVTRLPRGSDYDTITQSNAALCFGDSGGPAFLELPNGDRYVWSVNSRGNIRDTSYLSTLAVEPFLTWARQWTASNDVKICGLNGDATGCRGGNVPPPPPPDEDKKDFRACLSAYLDAGASLFHKSAGQAGGAAEPLKTLGACDLLPRPLQ